MNKANIKKWAKLAAIVAVFAILLVLPQPIQHYTAYGQGYGYGGTGAGPSPSEENVRDVTTATGEFTQSVTLKSEREDLALLIPKGTVGKTEDGSPLTNIRITKEVSPPPGPRNTAFVGFPFDLEPDGATFDPEITVTFTYDPNKLPSGVGPGSLTIGYYDADTEQWVILDAADITIDPATNTISAKISHFTYFGVLANTAPAEFEVSGLVIPTTAIGIAEKATIGVMAKNTGDVAGTTTLTLKINGEAVASKSVKLDGGEYRRVNFTTVQGKAGTYRVEIDGITGTFTVEEVALKPVTIMSAVPSVSAPSVEYPAPTAPAVPAAPEPVPAPTPTLAIILALVVTAIVAGVVVWYFGFRTA